MSKPGGDPSSVISSGEPGSLPERHPACRRREAQPGSCTERENLCSDAKGEIASGSNREDQSTEAEHRGGAARSRDEGSVMELDRRGCVVQPKDAPKPAIWTRGIEAAESSQACHYVRQPCRRDQASRPRNARIYTQFGSPSPFLSLKSQAHVPNISDWDHI